MDCQLCAAQFVPPIYINAATYREGRQKRLNYAYKKYCSRACSMKVYHHRRKEIQKVDVEVVEKRDLATDNPNIPGFRKLAMAVIELAKKDLEWFGQKIKEGKQYKLNDNMLWSYHTAQHFLLEDKETLRFWCLLAGWDCDTIMGFAQEISRNGQSMEVTND